MAHVRPVLAHMTELTWSAPIGYAMNIQMAKHVVNSGVEPQNTLIWIENLQFESSFDLMYFKRIHMSVSFINTLLENSTAYKIKLLEINDSYLIQKFNS